MKKRIISLLCAVLMLMAICVPAFAIGNEENTDPSPLNGRIAGIMTITIDGKENTVPPGLYVGYGHITTGGLVELAQRALNNVYSIYKNVSCYAGTVDGIFGSNTQTATINFQAWCNIDADGVVGPLTWKMFEKYCM